MASIEALTPADLERTIHIRGEAFLVAEALNPDRVEEHCREVVVSLTEDLTFPSLEGVHSLHRRRC